MTLVLLLIAARAVYGYLKLDTYESKLETRSDVWKSKKTNAAYRKKIEPLPKLRVW